MPDYERLEVLLVPLEIEDTVLQLGTVRVPRPAKGRAIPKLFPLFRGYRAIDGLVVRGLVTPKVHQVDMAISHAIRAYDLSLGRGFGAGFSFRDSCTRTVWPQTP